MRKIQTFAEIFAAAYRLSQKFFLEVFELKKLIEVALPLDVINKATARAVLFASLIDDPSEHPEKFPTPETQQAERERLFKIIGKIIEWENSDDEKLLASLGCEVLRKLPDKYFCLGGRFSRRKIFETEFWKCIRRRNFIGIFFGQSGNR